MAGVVLPITLGSNIASLGAQRRLANASEKLGSVFERLSSGLRINRASDDAAGLAVSSSLNAYQRIYTQGVRNLNDGVSALSIADGAIGQLSSIVTRQNELAEQAANGIYTTGQRSAMDREAQALNQEFSRIISTTEFNGIKLLDGTSSGMILQGGTGQNAMLNAQIMSTSTSTSTSAPSDNGTTTDSTFNFSPNSGTAVAIYGFLLGDLNGDGITDVAALGFRDNGANVAGLRTQVFLGKAGNGASWSAADLTANAKLQFTALYTVTNGSMSAEIGDYGSGKLDIRFSISADADNGVGPLTLSNDEAYTNTTSGGTFSMDTTANNDALAPDGLHTPLSAGGISIADFNGDGFMDNLVNNGDGTFSIKVHNTSTTSSSSTTINTLTQASFSLTTQANARNALTAFQTQLEDLSQTTSRIGASLSRISVASNVLGVSAQNFAAAESRITAADVAGESADLTRLNILQNTSAAVLAQANQLPTLTLQLLRQT